MSEQLARSAGFWLRAYPPAWRAQRADEVTAVLVDVNNLAWTGRSVEVDRSYTRQVPLAIQETR